jgi:hypothetical protein
MKFLDRENIPKKTFFEISWRLSKGEKLVKLVLSLQEISGSIYSGPKTSFVGL